MRAVGWFTEPSADLGDGMESQAPEKIRVRTAPCVSDQKSQFTRATMPKWDLWNQRARIRPLKKPAAFILLRRGVRIFRVPIGGSPADVAD